MNLLSPVLVVVAHPDDEVLGCGGTIARIVADGRPVHVVAATDGVGARFDGVTDAFLDARERREEEFWAACQTLGAQPGRLFPASAAYQDNKLDVVPLLVLVQAVERLIETLQPIKILTHHPGDLNIDHQLIARAVVTATRPYPGQVVKAVYGFEVPGSTEWAVPGAPPFAPARFVALTGKHLEAKLVALKCYASELRAMPHPRALDMVKALARVRGSQCGEHYAEAFTVIREIV